MNKSIVIYYTWAGHTKAMAEIISNLTGAALLEINPTTPYSDNYNTVVVQAKKEIQDGYLPSIPFRSELRFGGEQWRRRLLHS